MLDFVLDKSVLLEIEHTFVVFDEFISSTEGNINAFPVRIMVSERDFIKARKIITKE